MNQNLPFLLGRALSFLLICAVTFYSGIGPKELVWSLWIASLVSGSLAIIVPLWTLLLFPNLDNKLFPDHERPDFGKGGKFIACALIAVIFVGPYLFFMAMFGGFLMESVRFDALPGPGASWQQHYLWALHEYWVVVLITTTWALWEGSIRLLKLDPHVFFRPWALVVKMFVIVFIANFGWGEWTMIPLVAVLMAPEDFITRWGPNNEAGEEGEAEAD